MRKASLRLLLAALVAVFAFGSLAEAAPRKVHHRARHSTRVSSGTTTQTSKRTVHARKHRTGAAASSSTTTTTTKTTKTHRQSTKPR